MVKALAVSMELLFAPIIVETQQARRLLLYVLMLTVVLMLDSLRGWPQAPPSGEPTVTLGIEVKIPDRAVFYIPVVGDGEILGIVPFAEGPLAGIRITPRMRVGSVKIEVSALPAAKKKLWEATCEEVRSWKSEDAGTYEGKKDESVVLSGLGRLGLPVFEVKVVQAYGPPPGGFHHPYANSSAFCGCNFPEPRSIILDGRPASGVAGTLTYPDAGKCAEVGGCGQCCRMAVPASVQQGSMTPDQVNTAGWDKGWTNLVNDVEQTFTPSLSKLMGVEVQLVVGNAGAAEDHLTLTVLDATGRMVAALTESVQTADCDQVMFVIPQGGVEVAQFLPSGPTALTSEEWIDDYNQVKILGEVDSAVRTPAQSEIGLFWTEHTGQQYARAFGYLAENYNLDVMEAARMMAILWTGFADAAIGCWNAKFTYNFWRPVTAIQAGGGNTGLMADADWIPLGTTPSHPEYPAAHGCVTGSVSSLIRRYFRTRTVHIVVDSVAFSDGVHTHTFEDTQDLFEEVFWARIYAGFHYHHSLEDGGNLGRRVGRQLIRHHFRSRADGSDNGGDGN